ncbi:hypothetical protein [Streptomyces albidochromogenes]|uniref:Uncharacterized protein n=1 Tax=Streptomyces albidochromogenes TaxID=329524 RepID=A0ABW6FVG3_9ACTN
MSAELVREEVNRQQQAPVPSALDIDTVRMALALCTTAADLRDLRVDLAGNLSDDELKAKARRKGRTLGRRDIRSVKEDPALPTTETLHAFLLACDVEQRYIHEWHNTATRLRISQAEVVEPPSDDTSVVHSIATGLRSVGRSIKNIDLDTFISLVTLILMIIQLYQGWK